jgi:hypothetical protein
MPSDDILAAAREVQANDELSKLRSKIDALQRSLSTEASKLSLVTHERNQLRSQLDIIEAIEQEHAKIPEWLAPSKTSLQEHHATLCLLITDTHFDEVVDPSEVDGINAYNRAIAELRLRRCFERAILLGRHYLGGVQYDGVALFLGGDIFSGSIHDELARTNADTLFGSLLYWIGPMAAGIKMLADEFGKVHVSGVPGNHGRMTRKPIAKKRAADNLDWLLYMLLSRELASDQRVTWNVPKAADAHVTVYYTRYLLTHGDQYRGGSGISGAMAPLLLGTHRKTRRQAASGKPYDIQVLGHWHQSIFLPSKGLLVGGCLKGYDEFAYVSNFEPEPPQQALWITTPERGVTFMAPVFVMDRQQEGW